MKYFLLRKRLILSSILVFLACFSIFLLVMESNGSVSLKGTAAQEGKDKLDVRAHYVKAEYMIPMRDGIKLFTSVYSPKDTSQKYPILLYRTPYSIRSYGPESYPERLGPSMEFDRDGYIFVFQDVRGKFKSEGEFVLTKPHIPEKKSKKDTDESSDTYDTIDWLLQNIPNHNGRAGQWGISYSGWEAVMGMIDAHPALKASSPGASPSDQFIGDDTHHNGAFRLMYMFAWLAHNARLRTSPSEKPVERFDYGTPWGYKFFLDIGPLARIDEIYFDNQVPVWNELMEHGTYDEYWKIQTCLPHLKNIKHPVLNVAGWFDAEDFFGPMTIYQSIEEKNQDNKSVLVVGPWSHGGWMIMEGDNLGCIEFGSKTSLYFQKEIQFPFFNYHLKDKGEWQAPEAIVFETGTNEWRTYSHWPPRDAIPTNLYFRPGGKLSFSLPEENSDAYDSYISDPAKPVPYSAEISTFPGHLYMIEDQRFASTRPDVLVYQTDVLEEDITVAGPLIANLFVSTTGTDSDWIVKLIDVYPGNSPESNFCKEKMGDYQMLLAGEILRGQFRNSFSDPEPMIPNEVTEIAFDLRDRYHTFLKGHRIMIHLQSTWFPMYDRNPQKFVDIYNAKESDFQKAEQKAYRSMKHPSHLILRVLKREERQKGYH